MGVARWFISPRASTRENTHLHIYTPWPCTAEAEELSLCVVKRVKQSLLHAMIDGHNLHRSRN